MTNPDIKHQHRGGVRCSTSFDSILVVCVGVSCTTAARRLGMCLPSLCYAVFRNVNAAATRQIAASPPVSPGPPTWSRPVVLRPSPAGPRWPRRAGRRWLWAGRPWKGSRRAPVPARRRCTGAGPASASWCTPLWFSRCRRCPSRAPAGRRETTCWRCSLPIATCWPARPRFPVWRSSSSCSTNPRCVTSSPTRVAPRLKTLESILRAAVENGDIDAATITPLTGRVGPALLKQLVVLCWPGSVASC